MLYDGGVPVNLMTGLKAKSFPFHASYDALIAYLRPQKIEYAGTSLLDIGPGSDPELARISHAHAMSYEAIDSRPRASREFSEAMRKYRLPFQVRAGNIQLLPYPYQDKSFDLVHERFALMYLDPVDYGRSVRGCLRVAKDAALFLEYDWAPIFEDAKLTIVREFVSAMLVFFQRSHMQPFMGTILKPIVVHEAGDLKVEFRRYVRPPGNYRNELIAQCDLALGIYNELGCSKDMFEHLTSVRNDLVELHEEVVCQTPHIVSALVRLS